MSDQPTCGMCARPVVDMAYVCDRCATWAAPVSGPYRTVSDLHAAGMTWLEAMRETRVERARLFVPKSRVHDPVVYYMRMDGLVKIGTTTRISRRIDELGPQGVLAVEWGDRSVERHRHRQFDAHRSHKEWFWLRADLVDHVMALRARRFKGMLSVDDWLKVWAGQPNPLDGVRWRRSA